MQGYCELCGNVKVEDVRTPCLRCLAICNGVLTKAYKVWQRLCEGDRKCCGRLCADEWEDKPHLYFHGKHWNDQYPEDDDKLHVSVECGVMLYADNACTYYLIDTDSDGSSVEYGKPILLPADPESEQDWQAFHRAMHAQLSQAAEAAFNDDWSTCEECGYHQSACDPHQHDKDCETEE